MITKLDIVMRRYSLMFAKLAGLVILGSALMVSIDVVTRSLLGWTLGGADELSGYALAIGIAWSLPYCLHRRANIRVDSFYWMLPRRGRVVLDVISMVLLGAFILLLTYRASGVVIETVARNSRSVSPLSVPLIVPQSIWLMGLVWYTFAYLVSLARLFTALLGRDLDSVFLIAGSASDHGEDGQNSVM
ncbi:TRAP transporter small permease [Nitratireductor sp. StC3]|uniref:TRAP transporter small permease subunit n=1 Tax=Nitratireductor sp. StC3 TaxID=2126741 RepID=UPI000D0DE66A|nr:TRAP transporter small permease [Nitratireductor sp. StC3]PSM16395.1 TRAP transporter small permease [Nitratireductor sp. StC3]